ncbi:pyridoxal phosphate synthase yaaE subunit [Caloranaerobacter azorensis DSM 13643]|uniref:Pyridoxal 5'-phosphate synthase subunit PdxT n=1 Tax=Caloranaerobacter azorensis DSM 13643 TaxID=1121264 RepID=A0A1M5W809_9FIRM|nr:pyridoxal 5'-phosphate synthase glutaminase subunit PdxT [Caloranaerobacter azorensis]SHH83568.1 pyridoxal phosphate synthase yaaE subunit [Caloranaerobacter azorensis DSM 13643]
MIKVGVLDFQGSVIEHIEMLEKIEGVEPIRVKYEEQIKEIDGLIIPGGESTTIGKIMKDFNIFLPLKEKILEGMPVWGTCAGMILLAKKIVGQDYSHLGVMDIEVKRNAYGSQIDSFMIEKTIPQVSSKPISLVFIRAPYIEKVGEGVEILSEHEGKIIAAREKNMLATSFHPELTEDESFHRYFVDMIKEKL